VLSDSPELYAVRALSVPWSHHTRQQFAAYSIPAVTAFPAIRGTGQHQTAAEYSGAENAGGRINFIASTSAGASTTIAFAKGLLRNGTAAFAGDLSFFTTSGGLSYERMRISNTGAVSFGAGGSAHGSSGQVLQSNGGSAVPTWVTPAAPTTANVLAATAGAGVGEVGTYAFLRISSLTVASPGANFAGSALVYSNANGGGGAANPAGTWKLMGSTGNTSNASSTSLFLRIS